MWRWVFRVSSECDHSSGSGARRTVVPWSGKCLVLWQFVCVCVYVGDKLSLHGNLFSTRAIRVLKSKMSFCVPL